MVIRIASILMRVCGTLALILGLLFWGNIARELLRFHILLGVLLVLLLWVVGVGQAFVRGGSWALAAGALLLGLVVIGVGMNQSVWLVGPWHWVIQVLHLLLGVFTVGVGQIAAARYQRGAAAGGELGAIPSK
jgi:hypothetical protein